MYDINNKKSRYSSPCPVLIKSKPILLVIWTLSRCRRLTLIKTDDGKCPSILDPTLHRGRHCIRQLHNELIVLTTMRRVKWRGRKGSSCALVPQLIIFGHSLIALPNLYSLITCAVLSSNPIHSRLKFLGRVDVVVNMKSCPPVVCDWLIDQRNVPQHWTLNSPNPLQTVTGYAQCMLRRGAAPAGQVPGCRRHYSLDQW